MSASIPVGTTVKLTVSKGKEIIVFPTSGIVGTKYDEARNILTKMGFKVEKSVKLNTDNQIEGTVSGSSLEAGGSYEKGTTVFLFVWGEPQTEEPTTEEPTSEETTDEEGETSDPIETIINWGRRVQGN